MWAQYLESKYAARPSPDPLTDLRTGWGNHAREPHAYRLAFGVALAVRPSAIAETPLFLKGECAEQVATLAAAVPLERPWSPDDIAELASFPAGPDRWINGQTVFANGGLARRPAPT